MNGGDNTTVQNNKINQINTQQIKLPLSECLDELTRELAVRERIYDRWVAECKLSWTEARDRYTRLAGAINFMRSAAELEAANAEQKKAFDEAAATMRSDAANA
jgi:hypothetical protein